MTKRIRDQRSSYPGVYLEKKKKSHDHGVFLVKYKDPDTQKYRMVKTQMRTTSYDWAQAARDRLNFMTGKKKPAIDLRAEQLKAERKTIKKLADKYFDHHDTDAGMKNREKAIHETDAPTLEHILQPFFKDQDITAITKADIKKFREYINTLDKRKGEGGYSDQSKRHFMGLLQRVLNHNDILFSTVFWKTVMPVVKKRRAKKGYLTKEETAVLRVTLDTYQYNPVVVDIMRILMTWGCRCSEITRLRWKNVDLKAKTVRLVDRKNGAPDLLLGMDDEIHAIFKRLRRKKIPMPELLVFPGENGQIRDTRAVSRAARKILNKAGIDKSFKPTHGFRDNTAFYVHKAKDIETAGKMLGHTSTRTTKGYIETIEDGHVEAVSIMSAIKEG